MSPDAAEIRCYDAHNHLQDERLRPHLPAILEVLGREPIARMVVNGSTEADWPQVMELARSQPVVLPSFGYHPWYVGERTPGWQDALQRCLDAAPAGVGEIGLDHWMKEANHGEQEEVFIWQLRLAAERNLPVSIHCLQAWGRLLEILRAEPRPGCGFVLHSFGGPRELVADLAKLGAYFSLPGYFVHERKVRQRECFKHVPRERLLLETDAPDQLLPDAFNRHPLTDTATGKPLNHPANLRVVYEFAADLLEWPLGPLAAQVEANFQRLFGGIR